MKKFLFYGLLLLILFLLLRQNIVCTPGTLKIKTPESATTDSLVSTPEPVTAPAPIARKKKRVTPEKEEVEEEKEHEEVEEENTDAVVPEGKVIVCKGRYAYAYHAYVCAGLDNCRGGTRYFNRKEARRAGYKPCNYCY